MNCQHQGCQCTEATIERNGRRFCSEECAEQAGEQVGAGRGCDCGHAGCSGAA